MLPEISLNVLDVAQNSIKAKATLIEIELNTDSSLHRMELFIGDNGTGMTPEQVNSVTDPFFTSRTTRKVGLGVPFLKQAAECTGGSFTITSRVGEGTKITAVFCMDHIDCMPVGDMTDTIFTLITMNSDIDFVYTYSVDGKQFVLDTRQFKQILGEVSLQSREVSLFIKDFLRENQQEIDQNRV